MLKYGDYRGQIYCEIEKDCDVDLPCNLDTTVDGVKLSTFFNFLREMTQEELKKEELYLDINDTLQNIDDSEDWDKINEYIESEVNKKYE